MRAPDLTLGRYLERWWLIPRNRFLNVYYHEFGASDGGDVHDHPWVNVSVVLSGRYREHFHDGTSVVRKPGHVVFRGARTLHRIELLSERVRTLFLTGPRARAWGFMTPQGWWVPHERYKNQRRFDCPDD